MPNINPWIIDNLGESSAVRRRAYAVLIDHLVPPSVTAELSGGLRNLHNEIEKWEALEEGALKEKFRASITRQIQDAHLDRDLRVDRGKRPLSRPSKSIAWNPTCTRSTTRRPPSACTSSASRRRRTCWSPGWSLAWENGSSTTWARLLRYRRPPPAVPEAARNSSAGRRKRSSTPSWFRAGRSKTPCGPPAEACRPRACPSGWARISGGPSSCRTALPRPTRKSTTSWPPWPAAIIPPGPGNSPERNPAVVPTGRNMYVMNPEEVPSRPSWEIGKTLIDQLLAQQLKSKGRYPKKVAFTLNSFATFQDYGVMESQILYLLGVRPVWDDRNLVGDVELIPAAELRRPAHRRLHRLRRLLSRHAPHADALAGQGHPHGRRAGRARQHRAPRQRAGPRRAARQGIEPRQAEMLSQARIFGVAPGQIGGTGYYYLVERSGQWNGRKDLMDTYLGFSRYVYTEGLWGKKAAEAYNRQIQGSEVLLRSWSDRTRSPLSNKYDWYIGGSLSLAIKQLTGKEPEWYLSDVRDADRAGLVAAEDALRRDYRVRLFNRKWIEGMMKEGYAGADQIAVHVSNTMGWAIMRDGSVSDDTWNEIAAVYVKDKLGLSLRQWFETQNPYAFQDMSEVLLESSRKGYWKGEPGLVRESPSNMRGPCCGTARGAACAAAATPGWNNSSRRRSAGPSRRTWIASWPSIKVCFATAPVPGGRPKSPAPRRDRAMRSPWPRPLRCRPDAREPLPAAPPAARPAAPTALAVRARNWSRRRRRRSRGRGGGRCSVRSPPPCCCCWPDSFIARACHE